MPHSSVYIIIVNYRKWEDTRECLASVLKSTYADYTVLVVDNHSQNQSLEQLAAWLAHAYKNISFTVIAEKELGTSWPVHSLPRITFIQNHTNSGFAAGNNLVLRYLLQEDAYTWLLNPDMVVEPTALQALLESMELKKQGGQANYIAGATIRSYGGNHDLLFYGGGKVNINLATITLARDKAASGRLDFISGACLFTPVESFRRYGLLPEDYFLYWEETDWCYRARQLGAVLYVCEKAVCYDKISSVIGKSYLAHYYYARNGLLFVSKFHPRKVRAVLFFICLRWLKRVSTGQWGQARGMFRGVVDFLKKKVP